MLDQVDTPAPTAVPGLRIGTLVLLGLGLLGIAVSVLSRAARSQPDDLPSALSHFLEHRGQLCLAKSSWPITVSAADQQAGTSDALQMPVLERLGLVCKVQSEAATQYELTPLGRKFYLSPGQQADGKLAEPDLCVGKLSLDKIVKVEEIVDQPPRSRS